MRELQCLGIVALAGLLGISATAALAQQQKAAGIVCWKDKAGKTVGCGDKVPPEYQDNANKVLNDRGITVRQTDAQLTPEQKQAKAAEAEQKKADAFKREEERRHDRALLDSFTNEKEIDLKRSRDIQQIEINISAQQTNLKNISDRQNEIKARMDVFKRENKPVPPPVQEDYDRLNGEKSKVQGQILQKRKEIVERNEDYDAMKRRFMELKGLAPAPAAAAPAAPAAGGVAKK